MKLVLPPFFSHSEGHNLSQLQCLFYSDMTLFEISTVACHDVMTNLVPRVREESLGMRVCYDIQLLLANFNNVLLYLGQCTCVSQVN